MLRSEVCITSGWTQWMVPVQRGHEMTRTRRSARMKAWKINARSYNRALRGQHIEATTDRKNPCVLNVNPTDGCRTPCSTRVARAKTNAIYHFRKNLRILLSGLLRSWHWSSWGSTQLYSDLDSFGGSKTSSRTHVHAVNNTPTRSILDHKLKLWTLTGALHRDQSSSRVWCVSWNLNINFQRSLWLYRPHYAHPSAHLSQTDPGELWVSGVSLTMCSCWTSASDIVYLVHSETDFTPSFVLLLSLIPVCEWASLNVI